MRVHNAIRMRAMLLGLGATLLLAVSARAQQDMDPTNFDVNPGAPSMQPQSDASLAAQYNATHQMEEPAVAALSASTDAAQGADLTSASATDPVTVVLLFGGVVLIIGYALVEANRARRSHMVSPRSDASGAAAL